LLHDATSSQLSVPPPLGKTMKRLRVYISSTFEDMKEYRATVFTALEKAGLEIARMEAYTAADERPLVYAYVTYPNPKSTSGCMLGGTAIYHLSNTGTPRGSR
jgi:hypothetical protein